MGAALDEHRCPVPRALPSRHFHRRLPESALCASWNGRAEPVAERDFAADREMAVGVLTLAAPRSLSAALRPYVGLQRLSSGPVGTCRTECMLAILGASQAEFSYLRTRIHTLFFSVCSSTSATAL